MMESSKPKRVASWLVVIGAAFALGAAGWYLWIRGKGGAPLHFSEAEARAVVQQKSLALGQLENALFEPSLTAFEELEAKLPQERLPVQNRLLGMLWALRESHAFAYDPNDPARRDLVLQQAAEALARLREKSDDEALENYLAARLAVLRGDPVSAVAALRQAAQAAPQNVLYPVQIYEILNIERDPALEEEARASLQTAWRLQPQNLYLVRKVAFSQVQQKDPRLLETLEELRRAYAPFFGTLQDQLRFDMSQTIDNAIAAVKADDWARAFGLVAQLHNAPERLPAQQFDHWRLNPHELEFVEYDFSPEFYEQAALPPVATPDAIPIKFAKAPEAWQLPEAADATSARLADFDLDGRADVILVKPERLEVFGRDADVSGWQLLASFDLPQGIIDVLPVDLDRDIHENLPLAATQNNPAEAPQGEVPQCLLADVDLVGFGPNGVIVLKNAYDRQTNARRLEAAPPEESLAALKNVLAAAVADVDHDGDLDLVFSSEVGMSLWSNRENFTFENITQHSQLPPAALRATTITPVDWDRDVYLDLLLANAAGDVGVWKNYGHRNFRWEPMEAGSSIETNAAPGAAPPTTGVLDADGNVAWDLLIGSDRGVSIVTHVNPRAGVVKQVGNEQVMPWSVEGLLTWDYDNDGYLDALVWNEGGVRVLRGSPDASFQAAGPLGMDALAGVQGAQAGDLDADGDLDLLMRTEDGPVIYLNDGGNAQGWLALSLGADRDAQLPRERVNMHGVGSLLELRAGPLYQARVVDGQQMHIGLGKRRQADLVRILWTNGVPQNVLNPVSGEPICAEQKLKGSCPYIYTWDGSQWVFYTDCLWAAPLGLQFARGVLAPAREWEYLTIDGDALPADGDHYRLMMTEELWEAAYLDEVRLIAVDHPADVEVFSNEKVGPAEIAQFRIYTVRSPQAPVTARNHRGRDVLELIARRDKKFVQLFEQGERQGLVEPHYLELDFGELKQPKQLTLFLSGWTFPTDTSLNLAIDQHPEQQSPQPPSLWVPNAHGAWIEAIPYLGFPGGKTKTIAIDLTGVFPTEDYRVRIQTSMELYWDAAFFSVDEQAAPIKQQVVPLIQAELNYRGYSARHPGSDGGPEQYDSTRRDTTPHWPPMLGQFTRYGEVTDLVQTRDDRLAIFGAGDALEVRFAKPPHDPPLGWKRDFLLYNVGWDKDADLNTVTGQTVEPHPFSGMSQYPLPATEADPDTPTLREYRKTHQVREQSRSTFWRQVRDAPSPRNE
jgi:hypothetical protein